MEKGRHKRLGSAVNYKFPPESMIAEARENRSGGVALPKEDVEDDCADVDCRHVTPHVKDNHHAHQLSTDTTYSWRSGASEHDEFYSPGLREKKAAKQSELKDTNDAAGPLHGKKGSKGESLTVDTANAQALHSSCSWALVVRDPPVTEATSHHHNDSGSTATSEQSSSTRRVFTQKEFEDMLPVFTPVINRMTKERDIELARRASQLAYAKEKLAERNTELAENISALKHSHQRISQQSKELSDNHKQLANKDEVLADRARDLSELVAEKIHLLTNIRALQYQLEIGKQRIATQQRQLAQGEVIIDAQVKQITDMEDRIDKAEEVENDLRRQIHDLLNHFQTLKPPTPRTPPPYQPCYHHVNLAMTPDTDPHRFVHEMAMYQPSPIWLESAPKGDFSFPPGSKVPLDVSSDGSGEFRVTPNPADDVFCPRPALPRTPAKFVQKTLHEILASAFGKAEKAVCSVPILDMTGRDPPPEIQEITEYVKQHVANHGKEVYSLLGDEAERYSVMTGLVCHELVNNVFDDSILDHFGNSFATACFQQAWDEEHDTKLNDPENLKLRDATHEERSHWAQMIIQENGFWKWSKTWTIQTTHLILDNLKAAFPEHCHDELANHLHPAVDECMRAAIRMRTEPTCVEFSFPKMGLSWDSKTMVHRNPDLRGQVLPDEKSPYVIRYTMAPLVIEKYFGNDEPSREILHKAALLVCERNGRLRATRNHFNPRSNFRGGR